RSVEQRSRQFAEGGIGIVALEHAGGDFTGEPPRQFEFSTGAKGLSVRIAIVADALDNLLLMVAAVHANFDERLDARRDFVGTAQRRAVLCVVAVLKIERRTVVELGVAI